MPRGGRGGGREFGDAGIARRPSPSPRAPKAPSPARPVPPLQVKPAPPPTDKSSPAFGSMGSTIAGTFIGSVLGTVLGHAISSRMYEGRDPSTGLYVDSDKPDTNPCKKELDYFLQCARYSEDQSYCQGASEALKKCAEKHKDYFEGR